MSGGTSPLSMREYKPTGQLGYAVAYADYGRGQPDITLSPDGRRAVVSTHTLGPDFALTFVSIERNPLRLRSATSLMLDGARFT